MNKKKKDKSKKKKRNYKKNKKDYKKLKKIITKLNQLKKKRKCKNQNQWIKIHFLISIKKINEIYESNLQFDKMIIFNILKSFYIIYNEYFRWIRVLLQNFK